MDAGGVEISGLLYRYTAQGLLDGSSGTAGRVALPTATVGATEPLFMVRPADGSVDGSILIGLGATGSADGGGARGLLPRA